MPPKSIDFSLQLLIAPRSTKSNMDQRSAVHFLLHLINDLEKILTILVFKHWLGYLAHALFGNPAITIGNALQACDLQALAFLYDLNECRCFSK